MVVVLNNHSEYGLSLDTLGLENDSSTTSSSENGVTLWRCGGLIRLLTSALIASLERRTESLRQAPLVKIE